MSFAHDRDARASRRLTTVAAFAAACLILAACSKQSALNAVDDSIRATSGGFGALSATFEPGVAEFSFAHVGSGTYEVDVSTDPNMATDTYVNFGSGSGSPIVVVGGATSWDKYTCGAELFWRVRVSDSNDVSEIQSTVVCAENPFHDLSSAFNLRQAQFVFGYTGASASFTIVASTRPDLSGELWSVQAARSPVRLRDPATAWPGYGCGWILYWRAIDGDGVRSPIQEKHVCGSVGFSDEMAAFGPDAATFAFAYRGAADDFRIDVSTVADMSTDVYVGFGSGNASPIEVGAPQARWDKYRCGATLYWQVRELSNGAVGAIQTTTVVCPSVP